MKTKALFIGAAFVLLLLAACGPSVDEAKVTYCRNLGNFAIALVNLRLIDENSTVNELKQAERLVEGTWNALANSASELRDAQFDELEGAYTALRRTIIYDTPGNATLAETSGEIQSAAQETVAQFTDIATTTCNYGPVR